MTKNTTNLHHLEETPSSKLETVSIERWPPDGVHLWLTNHQDDGRNLKEEPPDRIGLTSRICLADSKGHSGRNTTADSPLLLTEVGEPMENDLGESSMVSVEVGHQPPARHRILALYYVQLTGILNVLDERHGPDQQSMLYHQDQMSQ